MNGYKGLKVEHFSGLNKVRSNTGDL